MAKEKEIKNYEFTVVDGNFRFKVLKPKGTGAYSICGVYPVVHQMENGIRRLTRKETIAWCIKVANEAGRL